MPPATPRGRFVWHELLTTDPDSAIGFYDRVIGWKLMPWDQDPSYRMFAWKGTAVAGLMALPEDARKAGSPPHWLGYVAVPDVDATVKLALSRGGKSCVAAMNIPNVGRMAVLADPQGAVFAVFRPDPRADNPPDRGDDVEVGAFSWHELATTDWEAAWDFYRALFGWEEESRMDMGPSGPYLMFKRSGGTQPLGAVYPKPPEIPVPNWLPYIKIPNVDRVVDLVRMNRGAIRNGPMDVPGGDRIAQLRDPQGASIAVHAVAPAAAKPTPAAKPAARKPAAKKKAPKKKATKKRAAKKKPAPKRRAKKRR
jgi:predicted enzyme related to lactoylglutathione lyase